MGGGVLTQVPRFQVAGFKPDAVLFDAGGTLVLIDPDRFNDFLARWSIPAVSAGRLFEAHYRAMADYAGRLAAGQPLEFRWWVERFFELNGLDLTEDMARLFGGGKNMWNHPIAGAREAVEELRGRGYRVGVVSNSDGTVAEALAIAGFGGLFETVIDSTNVGVSKPDAAIFDFALEALGVPAGQTWYVGDSPFHDVGGARAAGLAAVVLVDPLGSAQGEQLAVSSIAKVPDLVP